LNSVLSEKVNASKEADYTLDASLNKVLIAGYKLRIGDDVYEDSIHQRLENLRRTLS
jgi:F0F1-type ATP synthase delta subunit